MATGHEGSHLRLKLGDGAWLGIDAGQRKSKVYAFCLVEARGDRVTVSFERGAWRPLLSGMAWPKGNAGVFEDLARPSRLSKAAEQCALAILDNSELVTRWRRISRCAGARSAVCVDAPAGFARPGSRARETEECAAACYPTPSEEAFVADMRRFSETRNETPLRQRYYWKLVGRVALAHVPAEPGTAPLEERALAALAARSAEDAVVVWDTTTCPPATPMGSLPLPPASTDAVRVREGFPSDTYARANGTLGVLAPDARALLAGLAAAPWLAAGNEFRRQSSAPLAAWMSKLDRHRTALLREIADGAPIPSMIKIPKDPSWADLWDAFACAFAACCAGQGCGALVGRDPARLRSEGAIVAPRTRG